MQYGLHLKMIDLEGPPSDYRNITQKLWLHACRVLLNVGMLTEICQEIIL